MAVLAIMDIEGGTVEQYDEVDEILGGTGADNAPEGLISHTAGETDTGLYVADVWESHGAMQLLRGAAGSRIGGGRRAADATADPAGAQSRGRQR